MSKEIDKMHIKPLHNEFDILYSKYLMLCSIDYTQFESRDRYDKSLCSYAFGIFSILKDDFDSVLHEIRSLEQFVERDDDKIEFNKT